MSSLVERFEKIQSNISSINPKQAIKIIAVSKTFPLENIRPLIDLVICIMAKTKFKKQYPNGAI